jgi:hypothetical protein
MKTDKGQKLDNLFREGLENPGRRANFREDDWDAMEAMLDENKRRGIVYLWPAIGSAAAMLLVAMAWFFMHTSDKAQFAVNPGKKPAYIAHTGTIQQGTKDIAASVNSDNAQSKITTPGSRQKTNGVNNNPAIDNTTGRYAVSKGKKGLNGGNDATKAEENPVLKNIPSLNNTELLAYNLPALQLSPMNNELSASNILPGIARDTVPPATKAAYKPVVKRNDVTYTRFAVTVLAAPDINGVGSFQNGQVGTNAGLLFSARINKKFTISTGAVYSKKPYMVNFDAYHTNYAFKTDPVNVSADCRVLDIPINIDYQLYNRAKNSFSIGTGLSSYFMLRENYHYNYGSNYTYGPTDYDIANKNKYLLGVLNLNATYQRQLNSKLSLDLEPYMKVPLTNIGYGQVKLQSTGLAVGLSWKLK